MNNDETRPPRSSEAIKRREFVAVVLVGGIATTLPLEADAGGSIDTAAGPVATVRCTLSINGEKHTMAIDPRVTVLDLLREHLHMTGTKKGCDHGQCGACTVLVNGRRVNSCLTLALAAEGEKITTIEGLAEGDELHPMQAAFIEHDGFQCGYCTPGQIMSAVALLDELKRGEASGVTADLSRIGSVELTNEEVRERMSGNICRCGAYPNIVAAVRAVEQMGGRA